MKTTRERRSSASLLVSLADIDALQEEWRRLEERCPDLTPFSTWDWCGSVAKHYGDDLRPLVLAFRDGDDLVGVAPFAETRLAGLRLLRFLSSGPGRYPMADYQDFVVAEGHENEVIDALCDELARQRYWDMLHLQELPASSRTTGRLIAGAAARGWPTLLAPGSDVHLLSINDTWDSYKATLSRTTRNDTGRQTRKLIAERAASFASVDGGEAAVHTAMEALFDLHTRRWRAAGRPGILGTERRQGFDQEVAARFASRGMLMLSLLRSGEETIAVKYGFLKDGVQYHYAGGYSPDPEWNHFRLGMVLDLQIIKEAFEQGVRCVDFMRGDGHYKDHYRMETRVNQDLLLFRSQRARLQYRLAQVARGAMGRLRRKLTERKASPARRAR
jgi:CelD/BcsL family acetyltransferase involved in cellulose biosynthesis